MWTRAVRTGDYFPLQFYSANMPVGNVMTILLPRAEPLRSGFKRNLSLVPAVLPQHPSVIQLQTGRQFPYVMPFKPAPNTPRLHQILGLSRFDAVNRPPYERVHFHIISAPLKLIGNALAMHIIINSYPLQRTKGNRI